MLCHICWCADTFFTSKHPPIFFHPVFLTLRCATAQQSYVYHSAGVRCSFPCKACFLGNRKVCIHHMSRYFFFKMLHLWCCFGFLFCFHSHGIMWEKKFQTTSPLTGYNLQTHSQHACIRLTRVSIRGVKKNCEISNTEFWQFVSVQAIFSIKNCSKWGNTNVQYLKKG